MTDKQITDKELRDWQALCDAARDGPWESEVGPDDSFIGTYSGKCTHPYDGDLPIVDVRLFAWGRKYPSRETTVDDAEFVAQARTAMPRLIAEARRLQPLVEQRKIDRDLQVERAERAEGLLRKVEWTEDSGTYYFHCPVCGQHQEKGHKDGCGLGTLLGGKDGA